MTNAGRTNHEPETDDPRRPVQEVSVTAELAALSTIVRAMETLDVVTQMRVMRYLVDKYGDGQG